MERFRLTLTNKKLRSYHLLSWFIIILNIGVQLAFTLSPSFQGDRIWVVIAAAICLVLLAIGRRNKNNFTSTKVLLGIAFLVASIIWFKWQMYWGAVALFVFYILYLYSVRKFDVVIADEIIHFPSVLKPKIQWNELQNIILKDGILTIDFKNNKLLQAEIEIDNGIDERDFNQFCNRQLNQ